MLSSTTRAISLKLQTIKQTPLILSPSLCRCFGCGFYAKRRWCPAPSPPRPATLCTTQYVSTRWAICVSVSVYVMFNFPLCSRQCGLDTSLFYQISSFDHRDNLSSISWRELWWTWGLQSHFTPVGPGSCLLYKHLSSGDGFLWRTSCQSFTASCLMDLEESPAEWHRAGTLRQFWDNISCGTVTINTLDLML